MFHHVRATPARGCQTQFGGLTVQSRVPTPARNSTWASIFTWIPPNLFYPPSPTSVAALLMSLRIHPPGHCRARPRRSPPPPPSPSATMTGPFGSCLKAALVLLLDLVTKNPAAAVRASCASRFLQVGNGEEWWPRRLARRLQGRIKRR
jgi:hypothetical protein